MRKHTWILVLVLILIAAMASACGEENQEESLESWESYENPYYTLQYPEDFRIQEEDLETMISTLFIDENEEKMIGVVMNPLTDDFTAEELYAIWDEDLEETKDSREDFFYKEREIQGNKAYEVHFDFSAEERVFRVLTVHGDFMFSMDARVPQEDFEDFLSTSQRMVDSLEFLD